jgi:hypothetical protein
MLSQELEYNRTGLECFLQGWNALYRVGIPLYRVGMLSRGLEYLSTELEYLCTESECFLEGWNAFDRVGIPLYTVGKLTTGLECFRQSWNTFVQGWNAF